MSRSCVDPEKEWMEKLFDECEDEFCESFGVYDGKSKPLILNFDFRIVF